MFFPRLNVGFFCYIRDMEQIEGKDSLFYIKYNGIWFPISCETSSPISESTEMINTTTRDNNSWKTELPTNQSYSIQVEAVLVDDMDYPNLLSFSKIRRLKRDRELIEWKRTLLNGLYIDSGKAHISQLSDANPVEDIITFSMTLNGFGEPLESTDRIFVLGESDTLAIGDKDNNLIEA